MIMLNAHLKGVRGFFGKFSAKLYSKLLEKKSLLDWIRGFTTGFSSIKAFSILFFLLFVCPLQAMEITKSSQKKSIANEMSNPKVAFEHIRKLIEEDGEVNGYNAQGLTPLLWAVRNNRVDLAKLLIDRGAYVDKGCSTKSSFIDTVLKPVKRLLVDKDEPKHRHTPLIEATFRRLSKMSSLLIISGANPNVRHEKMGTPLSCAMNNKLIDVVLLLVKYGVDINSTIESNGMTPLVWVAQNGYSDLFDLLFERGADLNESLGCAAELGYLELCRFLLKKGAKVNGNNKCSQTPLARAAYKGHAHICALLLEKGARENDVKENKRSSSLVTATQAVFGDMALSLLDRGHVVNLYPKDSTPLIWAARNGYSDLFDLLVERGANLNESLCCAADLGYLEICALLLSKGAHADGGDLPKWDAGQNRSISNTPLHNAACKGHIDICQLLLKVGADIEGNNDNWSPLCWAAYKKQVHVCMFLIKCGADVRVTSFNGVTILDLVVADKDFEDVCFLLIDKGAEVNSVGLWDESPLKWACNNNSLKLVERLIQKGADIYKKSSFEKTTLEEAAERNQKEMVQTILLHGFLQVMAKDSKIARERIFCVLCSFKRKWPRMPKDIKFLILKKFFEDISALSAERIRHKKPIPCEFKEVVLKMGSCIPDNFIKHVQEAQKMAQNNEMSKLFEKESLHKNLASLLENYIAMHKLLKSRNSR